MTEGALRTGIRDGRLRAATVVVIVATGLAVWAFRTPDGEIPGFHAELASAAEAAGFGGEISMAEVADFDWDTVHAFPAYYTVSKVEEQLGFSWSPMSPAGTLLFGDFLLSNEGLTLLVFVADPDDVTGWTVLGTQYLEEPYIEISADGNHVAIDRDRSTLEVMQPEFVEGSDAYLLAPSE